MSSIYDASYFAMKYFLVNHIVTFLKFSNFPELTFFSEGVERRTNVIMGEYMKLDITSMFWFVFILQ